MFAETFLIRMPKGSGLEGLGGMYPITVLSEFPHVNILRPLLEVRKAELQEVCRREGVEWIEDPSNQSSDFVRNNIRQILRKNEDLFPGIVRLIHTCQNVREELKQQGEVTCSRASQRSWDSDGGSPHTSPISHFATVSFTLATSPSQFSPILSYTTCF